LEWHEAAWEEAAWGQPLKIDCAEKPYVRGRPFGLAGCVRGGMGSALKNQFYENSQQVDKF